MSKKLVILGTVISAAAIAWVIWLPLSHPEPAYQGKSLSAWMEQQYRYTLRGKTYPDMAKAEEAREAIRQIGTNALPSLIGMVRARDSGPKTLVLALASRQALVKLPFKSADYYHSRATWGFSDLGPAAKPVVPALIGLLHDQDKDVRAAAAQCLSLIGPDAREAVPALIETLNAEGNGWGPVLINSMLALGTIQSDPETVIPLLLEYVDGPRKEWNYAVPAMDALHRYREKAKSAVPAILPYLNDPDASRRSAADAALCAIDPDGTVEARRKALGL